MLTSCLWRRLAILLVRTRSAAFFAQRTAARIGRKYFTKTKTRAGSTSRLILTTQMSFLLPCGRCVAAHGIFFTVGRGAGLFDRMIEVGPGRGRVGIS